MSSRCLEKKDCQEVKKQKTKQMKQFIYRLASLVLTVWQVCKKIENEKRVSEWVSAPFTFFQKHLDMVGSGWSSFLLKWHWAFFLLLSNNAGCFLFISVPGPYWTGFMYMGASEQCLRLFVWTCHVALRCGNGGKMTLAQLCHLCFT